MLAAFIRRGGFLFAVVVLGLAAFAAPAWAQTGQVKGKVIDAQNKPVEGAKITIELMEGMTRRFETKTDRRGNFIQIGLSPGMYRITAEKDGLSESHEVRIRLDMSEVNFVLKPAAAAAKPGELSKEERAARSTSRSGAIPTRASATSRTSAASARCWPRRVWRSATGPSICRPPPDPAISCISTRRTRP